MHKLPTSYEVAEPLLHQLSRKERETASPLTALCGSVSNHLVVGGSYMPPQPCSTTAYQGVSTLNKWGYKKEPGNHAAAA